MNVTIIGTGNVGQYLIRFFSKIENINLQICGRNSNVLHQFAVECECATVDSIKKIDTNADFTLLAVSDNAYKEVIEQMPNVKGIVIHTAGSVPLAVFGAKFNRCGVMYPLQTFSATRKSDFKNIPFCVEASDTDTLNKIHKLSKKLSKDVRFMNSEQRKVIHLAAVFACNFTNHMYTVAAKILESQHIPFAVFQALITETAKKACEMNPVLAQTGPAMRNDQSTIKSHLEILESNADLQKLYSFVSESIANFKKQEDIND